MLGMVDKIKKRGEPSVGMIKRLKSSVDLVDYEKRKAICSMKLQKVPKYGQ